MTRINVIPPRLLSDKHLTAENYELPRIITAVEQLVAQGKMPSDTDIPDTYVLGRGHMKFFYDKFSFLLRHYSEINCEMNRRNMNPSREIFSNNQRRMIDIPIEWHNDFRPDAEALYLNMARLAKRSKMTTVLEELNNGQ